MKKKYLYTTLTIAVLSLASCSFGYDVQQNFTPLDPTAKTITCETQPENVELVFESEKVNFEYEKIGIIEIQGERSSTDTEMLEKIKGMAKSKCCDAIINLKRDRSDRQSGLLFKPEYDRNYSAITFHGIAVRKKTNLQANQSQNQQQ